MNIVQYDGDKNEYAVINSIKVFCDHTNERLKILDHKYISDDLVKNLIDFASHRGFGKIISNCRSIHLMPFIRNGFVIEGVINGFFMGEDAFCISYFIDPQRQISPLSLEADAILCQCGNHSERLSHQYKIRPANAGDIPKMIKLFLKVFETYPSPVFSREYLEKAMREQVLFKVVEDDGKIISIASADMNKYNLNAEITDCATYPEYRGKGLLASLIASLETDLKVKGFRTAYSLARSINPGINKALSRSGYKYGGRMLNNCHICGGFEDMNIWSKNLESTLIK